MADVTRCHSYIGSSPSLVFVVVVCLGFMDEQIFRMEEWNSAGSVGLQGFVLGGGNCGEFRCSPGVGHGFGAEFLGEMTTKAPEFLCVGFSAHWWHSEYKNKIPFLISP